MMDESAPAAAPNPLRILFFGLPGVMGEVVLPGLLARGFRVRAVIMPLSAVPHLVPKPEAAVSQVPPPLHLGLPVAGQGRAAGLPEVAWEAGLDLLVISQMQWPAVASALRVHESDVAVVACYPQRIPRTVLDVPRLGFLNLHPSLLPAYRGPSPLFWQFRDGVDAFGMTVHFMDERFDHGPIAAQAAVALPDGSTGPEADRLLAQAGVALLARVLDELAEEMHQPRPQAGPASYAPRPDLEAFTIPVSWTARRAFNFIRGTMEWGQPYRIVTPDGILLVTGAEEYRAERELGVSFQQDGDELWIRFGDGLLRAVGHRETTV